MIFFGLKYRHPVVQDILFEFGRETNLLTFDIGFIEFLYLDMFISQGRYRSFNHL